MNIKTLRQLIGLYLKEHWQDNLYYNDNKHNATFYRTVGQNISNFEEAPPPGLSEDPYLLDKDGVIVEPDVREKISKYLDKMGLTDKGKPGKTYK